jgi:hypothetical protein
MLLLNTLPAFAKAADLIPVGGKWRSSYRVELFDSLQAACEFDFNIIYKDQAPISPEIFPVVTPACWIHSLSPDKYLYDDYRNIGYCYTERPKLEVKFDKGEIIFVCANDFDYIDLSSVAHTPTCPAPVNGQRAAADCTQNVSLMPVSGQAEPRPKGSEGGDGKSTYDLIAKVTEGNQPKAGMALTFTVEVEAGSGNHPLNPPDRPKGELSVKSATTNASGEVKVTFTSPIFSGTHKVKVTCDKCTGNIKEVESKFNVKVPNLIKTPADINWRFISNDNYHKNNNASTATQTVYYLTQPAYTGLIQLTKYMVNNGWKTNSEKPTSVGLNDASLEWGGKFYSYKSGTNYIDWTSNDRAHKEHRIGVQIDLRTTDVSNELEKQMYQKICNPQDGKYPVQAKILWHTGVQKCKNAKGVLVSCTPEHYHAYLLGDIDKKLGGGRCSSTPN